jgi:hypothetical protein
MAFPEVLGYPTTTGKPYNAFSGPLPSSGYRLGGAEEIATKETYIFAHPWVRKG